MKHTTSVMVLIKFELKISGVIVIFVVCRMSSVCKRELTNRNPIQNALLNHDKIDQVLTFLLCGVLLLPVTMFQELAKHFTLNQGLS